MSGTPQRRKDGKLVVCVQLCGCKVCEVLLKSRDPHLASEEKEKPKEGRKEREGKGRKQAAPLIREEEWQRKERGRKERAYLWCGVSFLNTWISLGKCEGYR